MNTNTVATVDPPSPEIPTGSGAVMQRTITELNAIRAFVVREMREGFDFGTAGTMSGKPTLLLPGAQKTFMYFNVYPRHGLERFEGDGGHVEYVITTRLISRISGVQVGSGLGSASTMETKYRFRKDDRGERYDNPNIHDMRNTVLKIAKKRSQVDAALGLACMSELFTQDLEDVPANPDQPPARRRASRSTASREAPSRERERAQRRTVAEEHARRAPPADPPAERMPAKTTTPRLTWAEWITRRCQEITDSWYAEMTLAQIPKAEQNHVDNQKPNRHAVTNHFVSRAIEAGTVKLEDVSKDGTPEGPRDAQRAMKAMDGLFQRSPRRVADAVMSYFREKEGALRVRLGMDDL